MVLVSSPSESSVPLVLRGSATSSATSTSASSGDPLLDRLRTEANEVISSNPALLPLLDNFVLSPKVDTFEDAIANIVAHRLTVFSPAAFPCMVKINGNGNGNGGSSSSSGGGDGGLIPCSPMLLHMLRDALASPELEANHDMSSAIRADAEAIVRRDPACETLLEAIMFFKGFAALVCHRAARRKWPNKDSYGNAMSSEALTDPATTSKSSSSSSTKGDRFTALLLQSQAAAAFGVDIHPAASIGAGVVIDHGTGVVIGETATVGDGCTILHGVTLGGTAKDGSWDRHPKIGQDVLIGAGSSILGNIKVGNGAKIGSGSVVLRPIPSGATAVGAPAKIIGFAKEEKPGSDVDLALDEVEPLVKRNSSSLLSQESSMGSFTSATVATTEDESGEDDDDDGNGSNAGDGKQAEEDDNGSNGKDQKDTATVEDTSSMPPGCREWVAPKSHNRDLCPFRALKCGQGTLVPPGAVTRQTLVAILLQEGCKEDEIGEVYFALLRCTPPRSEARKHGYIPPCTFKEHFPDVAAKFTSISPCRAKAISRGDGKELKLCRRASKAFKKTFKGLQNASITDG
mmetsp:Transcript_17496/g.38240  ORF Transcript_17496/g.38240 Transcript_17496/m.38240 type:complete len:573 (+) Transcript_17496:201-1919(+)